MYEQEENLFGLTLPSEARAKMVNFLIGHVTNGGLTLLDDQLFRDIIDTQYPSDLARAQYIFNRLTPDQQKDIRDTALTSWQLQGPNILSGESDSWGP